MGSSILIIIFEQKQNLTKNLFENPKAKEHYFDSNDLVGMN